MERYFPPGWTDLVLFPLEHIFRQELLDNMLQDCDEVAVLSVRIIWSKLFLDIYLTDPNNISWDERNLRTTLEGEYKNRTKWSTRNLERPVHHFLENQVLTFLWRIGNQK